VRAALDAVSEERILAHAARLGSDAMEGRGTGSPGEDSAAAYIAGELRRIGLRPMGDDGSFFQRVPMRGSVPLSESRLEAVCADTSALFTLGEDYLLYTLGEETLIPQPVPLVFAGYGIVAPEFDYSDYQEMDVEGRVVVFLEGEPPSDDPAYFGGAAPTIHSLPEIKQRAALARGALGSVMVPSTRAPEAATWEKRARNFAFEHVTLLTDIPRNMNLVLREEAARLLFRGVPYSLDEVLEMDRSGTIRSFPLRSRIRFQGAHRERGILASNVAGLLEGSDPLLGKSCLLLSAHYDHLGIGPAVDGDSIYNGIVDNALGCAGLLEIAEVLARGPVPTLRPILFLFTTGEEKGLLGARHYCSRPAVPLHRTIANINIQGLAILDVFDDVIGIGSEYSTLGGHLDAVAAELGLSVSRTSSVHLAREAFARSDQLAFAQAGIPALLITDGVRYRGYSEREGLRRFIEWEKERYHTPFDDMSQPMSGEAIVQHCRVVLAAAGALANTFTPPQWNEGSEYARARLRSIAEGR
jgi:Zn-dependent M28 family amino/carboxypeptidase